MRIFTLPLLLLAGCIGFEPIPYGADSAETGIPGPDATYGSLLLSPSSLDFGLVEVGESDSKDLVVENIGADSLSILSTSVGGDSLGFSISSGMVASSTDLQPDQQLVVSIDFEPQAEANYEGELLFETDMPDSPQISVPLTGEGWIDEPDAPTGQVSLNPATLDLGTVDLDGTGSGTFTITNTGNDYLLLDDIKVGDSALDYSIDFTLGLMLAPSSSKNVLVTLDPVAEGNFSSWVSVETDDPSTPSAQVEVTAQVEDLCSICMPVIDVNTGGDPYAMSFYVFTLFSNTDTQTVTITNIGDQTLVISGVEARNDIIFTYTTFSTNWSGTASLDPYASTSFQVTWTANGTVYEGSLPELNMNVLHIYSNDPYEPDYVINLSGIAVSL